MKHTNRCISALMISLGFTVAATAQAPSANRGNEFKVTSTDFAATFTIERAKIQSSPCSCFWLKGGSGDLAITFYRGLGVAGNVTTEHASNILPGVNLGKVSFMAGPRYTFVTRRMFQQRTTRIFGEALFGGAHGFDSTFPGPNGITSSAESFSMQLGVGTDINLHNGFGLRPLEVDFVRTSLPNGASDSQNDLRLAFGVAYRRARH
jgi:outer membrane immunogenic protein